MLASGSCCRFTAVGMWGLVLFLVGFFPASVFQDGLAPFLGEAKTIPLFAATGSLLGAVWLR